MTTPKKPITDYQRYAARAKRQGMPIMTETQYAAELQRHADALRGPAYRRIERTK